MEELTANASEFEERWFDRSTLVRLMSASDRSPETDSVVWRAISTKLWLRNHWSDQSFPAQTPSAVPVTT